MKKSTLKISLAIVFFIIPGIAIISQVPQGFNYQAIARDGNNPITTPLPVRITIQSEETGGTTFWIEEHASVTPDDAGLFTLVIGTGEKQGGSTANTFDDIDWSATPKYIKTEIYYSTWKTMGSAKLWTVPYAMVSGSAFSGVSNPFVTSGDTILISKSVGIGTDNLNKAKLAVTGDNTLSEDALFEVKRKDGQTMFAVYNQGVRINIPMIDGTKGAKGGFAIGGFSGTKGTLYDLFSLNKDSARIYLDKTPKLTKGAKGGFAIGGFAYSGKTDIEIQNYLSVTPDSTRVYVKEGAKGAKGGFAIGGFAAKGSTSNFLDITKDNYFIGHESGSKINGGLYNSVIGFQAGKNLTTGSNNTILGHLAGISVTEGASNIVIGDLAGFSLNRGIHNTLIGNSAGYNHTIQEYNVMIGTNAGFNINETFGSGSYNTFMGINAGYKIRTSIDNTFIGTNAGALIESGNGNTIVGIDAGRGADTWDPFVYHSYVSANNTLLGNKAGYNLVNGSRNVFIGFMAGYSETGSDRLYIHNNGSDPTAALIYGEFDNSILRFNARVGIGVAPQPANMLEVNGKIYANGDINLSTGSNYKINGTPIALSQWTNVSEGIQYNSSVGINFAPNLLNKLTVGGNVAITGNLSAAGITGSSLTGNVTGSLNGNVTGNVSGNVTGNVTGDVTGKVNGMTMGKVFLNASGNIVTIDAYHECPGGYFYLEYDKDNDKILINNTSFIDCYYWYRSQRVELTEGLTGKVPAKDKGDVVPKFVNDDSNSFEIHFGYYCPGDGTTGYCSVWLQNINGVLVGHYTFY